MTDEHLTQHRTGFPYGRTSVTEAGVNPCDTGISFDIVRMRRGESLGELTAEEVAVLLLEGAIDCTVDGDREQHVRHSIFDDGPFCIHMGPDTEWSLRAEEDTELAIFSTANTKTFPPELYFPNDVGNEERGKGQVEGSCLRWVRTIFDDRTAHPDSQLVLGEVVNMPGRWSSYPPHHQPQPEIYHYRFSDPRGFGHSELGESVLKVRQYDTVKILNGKDHAQCAAPGYAMYYIWVIRHLPEQRYTVPKFTPEHAWTLDSRAHFWSPQTTSV